MGRTRGESGEVEIMVVSVCMFVCELQHSSEGGNIIHFHANTLPRFTFGITCGVLVIKEFPIRSVWDQ